MGLIARILDSFKKNGALTGKIELYQGDNADAEIYNPPGVDARPLDDDICFSQDSENTDGGKAVTGFIDPKNEPVADKGEHRTYSRDEDGNIVAIFHLKKDGTLQIDLNKDFIQNIKGDVNQTIDGNVVIKATKFSFGNGTDELLSLTNDNFTEVIKGLKFLRDTITFSNGGGPTGPPVNGATLSPIISSLEAAQTKLGNIKV